MDIKFLVEHYDKCCVEEMYPFADENSFRKHLRELLEELDDVEIVIKEEISTKELVDLVNEKFNYSDGDFWRIMYKVEDDGIITKLIGD